MAKTKDKNKTLLIISAILIAVAVIITCVSVIYEKTSSDKPKQSESVSDSNAVSDITANVPVSGTGVGTTAPQSTKPTPSASENKIGKYKVATKDDPLGIRIEAEQNAQRVGEIPKGTEIEVLAFYGDWGYVIYDGVSGWVSSKHLEFVSASDETAKHTSGKYKIATQNDPLGIRTKPEQDAERNGEIPKGEEVEILAVYGDWGYVKHDDKNGWISFDYLEKVS